MTQPYTKFRFIRIDSDTWHRYEVYSVHEVSINFILIRQSKLLCRVSFN